MEKICPNCGERIVISDEELQELLMSDVIVKKKDAEIEKIKVENALLLKAKDEEIAFYKDFKAKQSTKAVGESLEQFCLTEFNKIRATAFRGVYFEKDNDAKTGSKGDFIYRENDENGVEILSIMFEMKNEMDTTATKHKNEDFFKELDKDREEKKCEYAVLVSMLEVDNDFYNIGIADVSYKYDKMYVIRPQFFIPMITILRNAAYNSLKYKQAMIEMQRKDIDLTNFEAAIDAFKLDFGKSVENAGKKFTVAIDEIDKTIDHLTKIREALLATTKNLNTANKKVDKLSIQQLTESNPGMRGRFDNLIDVD